MPAIKSDDFYPKLLALDWGKVKSFKAIVIHHSATPDNPKGYSWNAIRDHHMKVNGWTDIGYHVGCEMVDNQIAYLFGRPFYEYGSHAKNWNGGEHASIGLMACGNYGAYTAGEKSAETGKIVEEGSPELGIAPPEIIWDTMVYMACALKKIFREKRKQELMIVGHRETYYPKPQEKSCPGYLLDMVKFRKEVQ